MASLLHNKKDLLNIYENLRIQHYKIMSLNCSIIDDALDKYGEIVWNVEDPNFDKQNEDAWAKQYPYIINARKHKGIKSPEGALYLNRIWRKGKEVRVDGYGAKGILYKGWKSEDVEGIIEFVYVVHPEICDEHEMELNEHFEIYNLLMREFIDVALKAYSNRIVISDEFYDIDRPCILRQNIDYFEGIDKTGEIRLFVPKCVYRIGDVCFGDGELLGGAGKLKMARLENEVDVFRIIYGMVFGKDYLRPIVGWQICMIPDRYLLGTDKILLGSREMAEVLCRNAKGDWFIVPRKLKIGESFSDFVFRGQC